MLHTRPPGGQILAARECIGKDGDKLLPHATRQLIQEILPIGFEQVPIILETNAVKLMEIVQIVLRPTVFVHYLETGEGEAGIFLELPISEAGVVLRVQMSRRRRRGMICRHAAPATENVALSRAGLGGRVSRHLLIRCLTRSNCAARGCGVPGQRSALLWSGRVFWVHEPRAGLNGGHAPYAGFGVPGAAASVPPTSTVAMLAVVPVTAIPVVAATSGWAALTGIRVATIVGTTVPGMIVRATPIAVALRIASWAGSPVPAAARVLRDAGSGRAAGTEVRPIWAASPVRVAIGAPWAANPIRSAAPCPIAALVVVAVIAGWAAEFVRTEAVSGAA